MNVRNFIFYKKIVEIIINVVVVFNIIVINFSNNIFVRFSHRITRIVKNFVFEIEIFEIRSIFTFWFFEIKKIKKQLKNNREIFTNDFITFAIFTTICCFDRFVDYFENRCMKSINNWLFRNDLNFDQNIQLINKWLWNIYIVFFDQWTFQQNWCFELNAKIKIDFVNFNDILINQ